MALCYVGQKNGLDVVDFRGGESQSFVSRGRNYDIIVGKENLAASDKSTNTISSGVKLLKEVDKYPAGKEFILVVGRHASVVRRTEEGRHQYLELQSGNKNPIESEKDSEVKLDWKQQKEEQAKLRKQANAIKKLEEKIADLEDQSSALDEEIALPENASNSDKLMELTAQKAHIDETLLDLYDQWEALSE